MGAGEMKNEFAESHITSQLCSAPSRAHLEVRHSHDDLHVCVATPLVRLGVHHQGYQVPGGRGGIV